MGIVAGIALFGKGSMRGCAIAFVAVGADIFACFVRISMAAGTEFFRFSPKTRIVSVFKMWGIGIVACLAIQTSARAMPVGLPVLIDSGGFFAVQLAWLGRVVASGAVSDRPTAFPGRLGFGDARCVTVAVITNGGVSKSFAVVVSRASVGVPGRIEEIDLLMTVGAFGVDVFVIMPVMSTGSRWGSVTDVTTRRAELEAGTMRVAFCAILVFVMAVGRPQAMITRGGMTGVADAGGLIFVVVAIEIHRFLVDHLMYQRCIIGDGMGIVAGGAGLSQVGFLVGMTFPTGGLGVNDLTMRPVTDHTTVCGLTVVAMGIDRGPFQRARSPLIVSARSEQNDE